jgi:hypothetical protein
MSSTTPAPRRGHRRFAPVVWAASAVSAAVLILGVNGTLSAWTSAVITNDTNTVKTADALILKEVGPDGTAAHTSQTCFSSQGAGASNTYTCSTINKYGGITSPLAPGGSSTTDVTFTNAGSAAGTNFRLAGGACTQAPVAGSGSPAAANVCTNGELTVAVSCSNGATYASGSAWTDLVYAAGAPGSLGTLNHPAALASASSWTCRFTVALGAAANPTDQGITVTQPLTWTLS